LGKELTSLVTKKTEFLSKLRNGTVTLKDINVAQKYMIYTDVMKNFDPFENWEKKKPDLVIVNENKIE